MLDEIDKLGADYRTGSLSSALLEVLDPGAELTPSATTTWAFRTTCRGCSSSRPPTCSIPIQPAFLDRMEVINLSGYTEGEKLQNRPGST